MRLVPKNWPKFQHYADRRPPWIKLHHKLLDDKLYLSLPIASIALAPLLWLLASENEGGVFDAEIDELVFRLRLPRQSITTGLKGLIDAGFFLPAASSVLAPCEQLAPCSVSVSASVSSDRGESERGASKEAVSRPDDVTQQTWDDWVRHRRLKRATCSPTVISKLRKDATAAGMTLDEAMAHSVAQGHQGFYPPKSGTNGKASIVPKTIPEGYYGTGPAVQDL